MNRHYYFIISLLFMGVLTLYSCKKEAACEKSIWYEDADADGFGNANVQLSACTQPEGYVADNSDCDDTDVGVCPTCIEILDNAIDDNCNGKTDECPPQTECDCDDGLDNDGDGFIDCNDFDCKGRSGC